MLTLRTNFRDCQAWADEDLPLSTTNNEASKLYDAALSQYVGWYNDAVFGGLEETLCQLKNVDPDFVMGKVLLHGLDLLATGRSTRLDNQFADDIEQLVKEASQKNVSKREKLHAAAVKLFADGYMAEAADVWEDILLDSPTDMLAIKFAHDTYFYLGEQVKLRDSINRVFPSWNAATPLYSYLYGMVAFGEVENNFYDRAMKSATKGLEMNPYDAWSTHAVAHVLEMKGQQKEGIAFLSKSVDNWEKCGMLACHNMWHWALYHIENGEYEAALNIYDAEIESNASKSGAMLDIVDMTSLLYRLELEGVNVDARWKTAFRLCEPHLDDHITTFNDAHFLMSCLGTQDSSATTKLYDSAKDFLRNGLGNNHKVLDSAGISLMEAMIAYNSGDYQQCVHLLYPLRYKLLSVGGSNAQRDVFNLLLIHAALKSSTQHHFRMARSLIAERKALREHSPMTDRIIANILANH